MPAETGIRLSGRFHVDVVIAPLDVEIVVVAEIRHFGLPFDRFVPLLLNAGVARPGRRSRGRAGVRYPADSPGRPAGLLARTHASPGRSRKPDELPTPQSRRGRRGATCLISSFDGPGALGGDPKFVQPLLWPPGRSRPALAGPGGPETGTRLARPGPSSS